MMVAVMAITIAPNLSFDRVEWLILRVLLRMR
ncbi:hypothetical protein CbuK_0337 [Coxiella burnetii CbuK_Q154]|nr:hypothetical protein CbuK_0337 [Coxiella burnetii CbuK_Q154]